MSIRDFLTPAQVAADNKVTAKTVRHWINHGITGVRDGKRQIIRLFTTRIVRRLYVHPKTLAQFIRDTGNGAAQIIPTGHFESAQRALHGLAGGEFQGGIKP